MLWLSVAQGQGAAQSVGILQNSFDRIAGFWSADRDSVHASNLFRPNVWSVSLAPLALIDRGGGAGPRWGVEWRFSRRWSVFTEATVYWPHHPKFARVSGYRLKQEVRRYNKMKPIFLGVSIFLKQQSIDHTAIVPITDSTNYRKPYTLSKQVIAPAFSYGYREYLSSSSRWYGEIVVYLGMRFKEAKVSGLTAKEQASYWAFDVESSDFVERFALRTGSLVHPELSFSIRFGFDVYRNIPRSTVCFD